MGSDTKLIALSASIVPARTRKADCARCGRARGGLQSKVAKTAIRAPNHTGSRYGTSDRHDVMECNQETLNQAASALPR
ncbi:hypothetical protein CBOM_00828 [Ceraceosorus bombacis]|uniref:Uncharacterized protein n=1 Tax=Ceraceosorus bombacis TaxID=401625 RepID=A0A0P1BAW2_9BASI|nr:hypothetical protein CBOM_00828 [Ceraceosorus bombacis]